MIPGVRAKMRARVTWARAALVAVMLFSASGQAAPELPPSQAALAEARERFQRATDLFEENNYPAALAEFRRAYALAPNFRILYNVGQICFLLQDYPCALDSFQRYLAEGTGQITAQRQADVQRDVGLLEGRVARLRIVADRPGAEVAVNDVVVGKTPLAEPVLVAAGRPRVSARLSGHLPVSKMIEVAGQQTATVELALIPEGVTLGAAGAGIAAGAGAGGAAAAAPTVSLSDRPDRAPAGGSLRPVLGWVVTGALAVAAGTTGFLALRSSSRLEQRRGEFGLNGPAELRDRSRETRRLALASDILAGATVAAAGVSLYFSLSGPSRAEPLAALRIGPGAVVLGGAF